MLKIIGATLAVAFIAASAGEAIAHNPLPQRQVPRYVVHHIIPPCPPAHGYARTCA
ncbi:MAG TPA: hypothetical protein VN814_16045 [Caulobacteraceae bacterium]|nr:hypothetical protein [Caulobacteraceae bacterium]